MARWLHFGVASSYHPAIPTPDNQTLLLYAYVFVSYLWRRGATVYVVFGRKLMPVAGGMRVFGGDRTYMVHGECRMRLSCSHIIHRFTTHLGGACDAEHGPNLGHT